MKRIALAGIAAFFVVGSQTPVLAQQLSNFCERQYARYMDAASPKAFVTGSDGSCWWGFGQSNVRASINFAMNACTSKGRPGCRVYASSN